MDEPIRAEIYLITPPRFDPAEFAPTLSRILDAAEIACIRLSLASRDEDEIRRAADHVREVAHARDVAVVIEEHWRLVEPLGLDGAHLLDSHRSVREVRKALGGDRIVGAWCGASRHAGMTAAEIGADYVAFGPFTVTGGLGPDKVADPDLVRWWAEAIETPVVAEGGLSPELLESLVTVADFLALGPELWNAPEGPLAALKRIRG